MNGYFLAFIAGVVSAIIVMGLLFYVLWNNLED
jgi:hypothetical protein